MPRNFAPAIAITFALTGQLLAAPRTDKVTTFTITLFDVRAEAFAAVERRSLDRGGMIFEKGSCEHNSYTFDLWDVVASFPHDLADLADKAGAFCRENTEKRIALNRQFEVAGIFRQASLTAFDQSHALLNDAMDRLIERVHKADGFAHLTPADYALVRQDMAYEHERNRFFDSEEAADQAAVTAYRQDVEYRFQQEFPARFVDYVRVTAQPKLTP